MAAVCGDIFDFLVLRGFETFFGLGFIIIHVVQKMLLSEPFFFTTEKKRQKS